MIAKIPANATRPTRANNSSYTIELRRKAGWDRSIPEDAVLIHEVRNDGLSYLQPGIWGRFTAGQEFTTPDPKVFLRVAAIDPVTGTATLRLWDLPEGSLRKEDSKPKVYLIENGTKRWITSPQMLAALGKSWADVRAVPDGGLASIPDGPDMNVLTVSVTPYPVRTNTAVTVTVNAHDLATGSAIAGQVLVDGKVVANTNAAFAYTFRTKRRLISKNPPEWEVTYPEGVVRTSGYPETSIDFGFPDV